ncbi:ABC transporter permease [Pseudothermotoga sp.]
MRSSKFKLAGFLTKYGTILALFVIFLSFSFSIPGFRSYANLINVLRQISLLFIVSAGFSMTLIVGELDLSFASVASFSSVVVAKLIVNGAHPLVGILGTLGAGMLIGSINGLLVTVIGIPSLITTLAMSIIVSGITYMYTKGVSVYGRMPPGFLMLGRGSLGPVPVLVLIMFLYLLVSQLFLSKTKFGRHMQAVGGNKAAALLAGIRVNMYRALGMIISSASAAFMGILLTSRLGAANPEGAAGFLMDGFATALLGQTVISLGRASPFGTFIGALLIGTLNNGLTLLGVPYYVHDIAKGLIIILSVVVTSIQALRLERA